MSNINFDVEATIIFDRSKDTKTYIFRDFGTDNFKLNYDKDNNIKLLMTNTAKYDLDAIKNSIRNIFDFIPGQEILDPEFGNTIYQHLYKPLNELNANIIKREISDLIEKYQPRVSIEDIKLQTDATENLIKITIAYVIKALNTSEYIELY